VTSLIPSAVRVPLEDQHRYIAEPTLTGSEPSSPSHAGKAVACYSRHGLASLYRPAYGPPLGWREASLDVIVTGGSASYIPSVGM